MRRYIYRFCMWQALFCRENADAMLHGACVALVRSNWPVRAALVAACRRAEAKACRWEARAQKWDNREILVCAECLCASCWHGDAFCSKSRHASVAKLRVPELKALGREHPSNWGGAHVRGRGRARGCVMSLRTEQFISESARVIAFVLTLAAVGFAVAYVGEVVW